MSDKVLKIAAGEQLDQVFVIGKDEVPFDTIVLEKEARANLVFLIGPGVGADLPLKVDLQGPGADLSLSGAYLCTGNDKVDIAVELHHSVPDCTSRQLFKGIADDASRVSFYGKIIVEPNAQRTVALQENHSLLLSYDARVNTKPQLEIYADDVKCNHGATVGRLNEEEQFYMRSRGISLENAKMLQMISYIHPVLDLIVDENLRASMSEALEKAVHCFIHKK